MKLETKIFIDTFNQVVNNPPYQALLIMIIIDLFSGVAKGFKLQKLDSSKSTNGMFRHVAVLVIVTLLSVYGRILSFEWLSTSIGYWYIGSYGISILENFSVLGVPFPAFATKYFNRMLDSYEKDLDERAFEDKQSNNKGDK